MIRPAPSTAGVAIWDIIDNQSYGLYMQKPRTHVYVDGFNLYKRALEKGPYKWLDIGKMCDLILKGFDVSKIYYFTANVKSPPHDEGQAARQQMYFRALRFNPRVEIVESTFLAKNVYMPVFPWRYGPDGEPLKVKVKQYKEKGSDVNIATQMLIDAHTDACEAQFVITADSDLVKPVTYLKSIGRTVGLILPSEKDSKEIKKAAEPLVYRIRQNVLASSQYPDTLRDLVGEFRKPTRWEKTETPTEVGVSRPATEATGDVAKE